MKRFLCDGMKLYYDSEEKVRELFPEIKEVLEIKDTEHLPYINKIIESADNGEVISETKNNLTLYFLRITTNFGLCEIFLQKDARDGKFYDYIKYRLFKTKRYTEPVLWDISTPEKFVKTILIEQPKYSVLAWGNKIEKLPELKGIKRTAKAIFYTKANCDLFILGNDIYIKHSDYFSPILCKPEDNGTPLRYRLDKYGIKGSTKDFVYPDSWGEIVLRKRAWIKISNGYPFIEMNNVVQCSRIFLDLLKEYHNSNFTSEEDCIWLRFFEEIIENTKKAKENDTDKGICSSGKRVA